MLQPSRDRHKDSSTNPAKDKNTPAQPIKSLTKNRSQKKETNPTHDGLAVHPTGPYPRSFHQLN
ncbi:hypothetical protein IFM46972_01962 [Aspergillus udagawae]|uniref:Uncharacterized protein n=1 Tax=Aspergillus udagawae TaxID=91492 RepID=A0A8H3N8H8_9EURO|nr:hypothetical protein IFM46972_01962 [Aspergillus udagawae]